MHNTELELIIRVTVAWALTFALGFERAVRGAPAGDRTFSLIGAGTALIGVLSMSVPAVLGGAVTGIGFIGGGLCFRQAAQDKEILHGITTAASIFAAAAIGAAAGIGDVGLAAASTVAVLISLEIRHLPFLRILDARRWQPYVNHDDHAHFDLKACMLRAAERGHPGPQLSTTETPSLVNQAVAVDIVADQLIEASAAGRTSGR